MQSDFRHLILYAGKRWVEAGPLYQYRPRHFVPFKVPIHDKSRGDYEWVYRPEMQFSVFDLAIDVASEPDPASSSETTTFTYTLTESDFSPLERFGIGVR